MLQLLRPYSPVLRIRRSLVRAQVGEPIYSPIAQSVERRTVNPQVPGSSPGGRAKIFIKPTHCEVGFFISVFFSFSLYQVGLASDLIVFKLVFNDERSALYSYSSFDLNITA